MTNQLKNDIKTIFEVLAFIIIYMFVGMFSSEHEWIYSALLALSVGYGIYIRYYKRTNKNLMVFPTLNDNSFKMAPISFGLVICIFSVVGYFGFSVTIYKVLVLFAIGTAIFLFGFFELPKGWVSIENNALKIYGIKEGIDTRQLKEITIKNDKIILTNIYGENKNSNLLNLNQSNARDIKRFLEEKLHKSEILIVNSVTAPV